MAPADAPDPHTKARVRAQFGASAENYVASLHATGRDLAALVAARPLTGSERVLDVGTGPGHTALAFAPHVASVTGLDLVPEMLAQARKLAAERGVQNARYELGDAEAMPFPDASFEVVTCRMCFHHFAAPDRALAEMARVLVPGGSLRLVDSYAPEDDAQDDFLDRIERIRDPSHVRNYRLSEWRDMLQAAGFAPPEVTESGWRLDFAAWVARMHTPPEGVALLRELLASAPAATRRRYAIAENGDWTIPAITLVTDRTT